MQIEFLEDESPDCPLIRLYGVEQATVSLLHQEVTRLTGDAGGSCLVHKIPGFRTLSGCTFTLFSSYADEPVRRIGQSLTFEWRLTPAGWLDVAGLIEPFVGDPAEGVYQWLFNGGSSGDIAVLLSYSADGRW